MYPIFLGIVSDFSFASFHLSKNHICFSYRLQNQVDDLQNKLLLLSTSRHEQAPRDFVLDTDARSDNGVRTELQELKLYVESISQQQVSTIQAVSFLGFTYGSASKCLYI